MATLFGELPRRCHSYDGSQAVDLLDGSVKSSLRPYGFGLDYCSLSSRKLYINRVRRILSQMHYQGANHKLELIPRNKIRLGSSKDNNQLKAMKQRIKDFCLQRLRLRVWRELSSGLCKRHNGLVLY